MWHCIVCKETNEDSSRICKNCGFDQSRNWLQYPTISKLTPTEMDSWEKQRNSSVHYSDLAETHLKKAIELYKKSGNLSANEQDLLNVLKKTVSEPENPEDDTKQTDNPTVTKFRQDEKPAAINSRMDNGPAADHSRQDSISSWLLMGKTAIFSILSGILIYMVSLLLMSRGGSFHYLSSYLVRSRRYFSSYFLYPSRGLSIAFYLLCSFLVIGIAAKELPFYDSVHPNGRKANGTLFRLLPGIIAIASVCIDIILYISVDSYFWINTDAVPIAVYLSRAANIAGGHCLYYLVRLWTPKTDPKKCASAQLVLSGLFLMLLLFLALDTAAQCNFRAFRHHDTLRSDTFGILYPPMLLFACSYLICAWYGWFFTRKHTRNVLKKTVSEPENPEDDTKQTDNPTVTKFRQDEKLAAINSRQDSISGWLLMGKTAIFSILSGILIYEIALLLSGLIFGYSVGDVLTTTRWRSRISVIRSFFLSPSASLSIAFYILCSFLILGIAAKRLPCNSVHPDGKKAGGTLFRLLPGIIVIASAVIDAFLYTYTISNFSYYGKLGRWLNRTNSLGLALPYLSRAVNIAGGYCLYYLVHLWSRKMNPKKCASMQLILSGLFLTILYLRFMILQASFIQFAPVKFLYTLICCFACSYLICAWYGWFFTRKHTRIEKQKNSAK